MKVCDLIELLNKCPPDAIVVVNGKEGGLLDIDDAEQVRMWLNYHEGTGRMSGYGEHEEVAYWSHVDEIAREQGCKEVDAVVIA